MLVIVTAVMAWLTPSASALGAVMTGGSSTAMVIVAVADPPSLVAVKVKDWLLNPSWGVPETLQLELTTARHGLEQWGHTIGRTHKKW